MCPSPHPSVTPTYYIIIRNASLYCLVLFILLLVYLAMSSAHFVDSCLRGLNLVYFCCFFVLFCFVLFCFVLFCFVLFCFVFSC